MSNSSIAVKLVHRAIPTMDGFQLNISRNLPVSAMCATDEDSSTGLAQTLRDRRNRIMGHVLVKPDIVYTTDANSNSTVTIAMGLDISNL